MTTPAAGNAIEHRAIVWFVGLAFAPTWMLWTALWLMQVNPTETLRFALFGTLGMYFPGVAALVAGRFVLGEGLHDTTLLRLGHRRYYLGAWMLFPLLIFACLVLDIGTGAARWDPTFSQLSTRFSAAGATAPSDLRYFAIGNLMVELLAGPAMHAITTIGEELGWRDFLLRHLIRSGFRQRPALLITGIVWGLWHIPVILLELEYVGHPFLGIPMFVVYAILAGIIIGWLYLASGSVWVAAIAHGSLNAVQRAALVFIVGYDGLIAGGLGSILGWIPLAAFIAWLAFSGRLPADDQYHQKPLH
jgi:membrane protease YdiL (CAAX protease family)